MPITLEVELLSRLKEAKNYIATETQGEEFFSQNCRLRRFKSHGLIRKQTECSLYSTQVDVDSPLWPSKLVCTLESEKTETKNCRSHSKWIFQIIRNANTENVVFKHPSGGVLRLPMNDAGFGTN